MIDDADDAPVSLDITDTPAKDDIAAIHEGLAAYNSATALPFDRRDLCVFLRDEAGIVTGGLTGYTQWQWLYVDCLWLGDALRGSGLGTRLLAAAEEEARARGCRHVRLYTYNFQAPAFYEGQGYEQWGVLEDYPPGHRQIWYRKAL
ncbi:putative acetyltransferase [Caenispirillum salinarum AK4]|uniref:Putative acetyltransferase n=1 Tax=Caenispirillum salinarum AK4 TaxID=1238182 RepID=K9H9R9_9PROT|nr:GNAT family N-acetyltransferase [Caenispirillum salinarum]EKV27363.1 putative acetyltransferase [Caenispirillum salinarum AK4]